MLVEMDPIPLELSAIFVVKCATDVTVSIVPRSFQEWNNRQPLKYTSSYTLLLKHALNNATQLAGSSSMYKLSNEGYQKWACLQRKIHYTYWIQLHRQLHYPKLVDCQENYRGCIGDVCVSNLKCCYKNIEVLSIRDSLEYELKRRGRLRAQKMLKEHCKLPYRKRGQQTGTKSS